MSKIALITGITGQDGSYLSEHLLERGYEVHGVMRRASTITTERIDHIFPPDDRDRIHYGDLQGGLDALIYRIKPDFVYNIAAQSHVMVSFKEPVLTTKVNSVGVIDLLETIRQAEQTLGKQIRFYQASSSEMFGKTPPPQNEESYFHPASPYGCAKLFAYWATRTYRDSYNMYAANGILFNHECISERTPLIVMKDGFIDVVYANELVPLRRKGTSKQQFEPSLLHVWDGKQWAQVKLITATRRTKKQDHKMISIEARRGIVDVTSHHHMIKEDGTIYSAREVAVNDRLALAGCMPTPTNSTTITGEMAELLGHLSSEGYVEVDGNQIRYTNNDASLRTRVAALWRSVFMGQISEYVGYSGFNPSNSVTHLNLLGKNEVGKWLRMQLYSKDGFKRVPASVLNAPIDIQQKFLDGHYAGDGLKAGNGSSIKTNSPLLAQGLYLLYANQGRACSVYAEHRDGRVYYQLNISTDNPSNSGQHLRKDPSEVRKLEVGEDVEWVFDLETESGVFCAGVGGIVVHNSPRRGKNFVTKKVTRAAARIALGLQKKIELGNLDALRDWGHSWDYVRAMVMIMEHDKADDWVVSSGQYHSVREFAERIFKHFGLNLYDHLIINDALKRPNEVPALLGDSTKIRTVLGWKPKYSFDDLVKEMCDYDYETEKKLMERK